MLEIPKALNTLYFIARNKFKDITMDNQQVKYLFYKNNNILRDYMLDINEDIVQFWLKNQKLISLAY
jgi:hypothetical protein